MRKKKCKHLVRDQTVESRLTRLNQEWAMDFVVDGLAMGRMVHILSVVDTYTRECVALEADIILGSGCVTRMLEQAIAERGRPENLRLDNVPKFTSPRMSGWAEGLKVGRIHIPPGKPMQNGHVESFEGRLRDECLNTSSRTETASCSCKKFIKPPASSRSPRIVASSHETCFSLDINNRRNCRHAMCAETTLCSVTVRHRLVANLHGRTIRR